MSLRFVLIQTAFLGCVANFAVAQIAPSGEDFIRPLSDGSKVFLSYQGSHKLQEKVAQQSEADTEIRISLTHMPAGGVRVLDEENMKSYLQTLTSKSALVVEATPFRERSFACANATFVCTDYTVRINTIYYVNPDQFSGDKVFLQPSQAIVVSRPGGKLLIGRHQINAYDPQFVFFDLQRPYIFALTWDKKSKTFQVDVGSSFMLDSKGYVDPSLVSIVQRGAPPPKVEIKLFRQALVQAAQENAK